MRLSNRAIGTAYEQVSEAILQTHGYKILEKNFRCKQGEIDFIAKDEGYLVFIEVKYRHSDGQGQPGEAVNFRKQRRISRVALYYMMTKSLDETTPCRFDVVSILGEEVTLYKNAFEFVE